MAYIGSSELVPRVLAGDVRAIARLLTRAENGTSESRPAFDTLFAHAGRAHIVGITGVPGSGKSTLVVSAPGLGDDIQAIKAGILEIADVHAVSKCDRPDAERTIADLKTMLMLGIDGARGAWRPPIVPTSAARGEGAVELLAAIDRHRAALDASGEIETRRASINERRLLAASEEILRDRFVRHRHGRLATLLDALSRRTLSPHSAALRLMAELGEDT